VIDFSLLAAHEIAWLNDYHQKVWRDISPLVEGEGKLWLEKATHSISG
ncbi:M24 family metallopeptidase C-terminal domain-containing protein, partial [Vibrio parahaemolyticus]|nr:M24 family metallopeptidase C-terminal domain-containing protein [Vibrio parahaemolyticus]